MRIVLLSNSRSGRGLAHRTAKRISADLTADGHDVIPLAVGESHDRISSALEGAQALLLAGGDGTVHRTAREAAEAGVPVYHLPCGNENLFAREFGMTLSTDTVRRALANRRILQADIACAQVALKPNGAPSGTPHSLFLLMCGVGLDASVIRRLTALRTRAIGHMAYIEPVLRELVSPCFPRLTIEIDGRKAVDAQRGMLIVANSRQYALRIDPAHEASMTDGLLDMVFLPCQTVAGVLHWGLLSRLRRSRTHPRAVYASAREVIIRSDDDAPYQLDGDAPGWAGTETVPTAPEKPHPLHLRITLAESKLPVLLP